MCVCVRPIPPFGPQLLSVHEAVRGGEADRLKEAIGILMSASDIILQNATDAANRSTRADFQGAL